MNSARWNYTETFGTVDEVGEEYGDVREGWNTRDGDVLLFTRTEADTCIVYVWSSASIDDVKAAMVEHFHLVGAAGIVGWRVVSEGDEHHVEPDGIESTTIRAAQGVEHGRGPNTGPTEEEFQSGLVTIREVHATKEDANPQGVTHTFKKDDKTDKWGVDLLIKD